MMLLSKFSTLTPNLANQWLNFTYDYSTHVLRYVNNKLNPDLVKNRTHDLCAINEMINSLIINGIK